MFFKPKKNKLKFNRENTPYPIKQSVKDIDKSTIEKIEIQNNNPNLIYEYLPNSAVLHIYKKP